ncbi:hypothetical protein GQ457_01G010920 [Hibiscus cannabinus]
MNSLWELRAVVLPVQLRVNDDYRLVWKSTVTGHFSVQVLTSCLLLESMSEFPITNCFMWHLLVLPKVQTFLWFVCMDRLPMFVFLRRIRIVLGEGQGGCVRCEVVDEAGEHLLFLCPFAKRVDPQGIGVSDIASR